MGEIIPILIYFIILGVLLLVGDRLGGKIAIAIASETKHPSLFHAAAYLHSSVAVFAPGIIILGLLVSSLQLQGHTGLHTLEDRVTEIILLSFFLTGIVGGFMANIKKKR